MEIPHVATMCHHGNWPVVDSHRRRVGARTILFWPLDGVAGCNRDIGWHSVHRACPQITGPNKGTESVPLSFPCGGKVSCRICCSLLGTYAYGTPFFHRGSFVSSRRDVFILNDRWSSQITILDIFQSTQSIGDDTPRKRQWVVTNHIRLNINFLTTMLSFVYWSFLTGIVFEDILLWRSEGT